MSLRIDALDGHGVRFAHDFTRAVTRSFDMLDVLLLGLGAGFFIVSIGYVLTCDKL